MLTKSEAINTMVSATPGFRSVWEEFVKKWEAEGDLPMYVGMSELAHYIVEMYAQGSTAEFSNFFSTIEGILSDADPEVQSLIAVGLFEDIQNVASHRSFAPTVFREWLGPRSLLVWDEVDAGMKKVIAWAAQQRPKWWQVWRRRGFDAEGALQQVEDPELRKIIEATYRKSP